MAKPNERPYVQVASVCERVLQDDDKVVSAIRLVDTITMSSVTIASAPDVPTDALTLPAIQLSDLWLLVMLKSGDLSGDFSFGVQMVDPNEKVVRLATAPVSVTKNGGVNFKLKFGLPHIAPEGNYWFEVLWNGEVLTRFPLILKRGEPTKAEITSQSS